MQGWHLLQRGHKHLGKGPSLARGQMAWHAAWVPLQLSLGISQLQLCTTVLRVPLAALKFTSGLCTEGRACCKLLPALAQHCPQHTAG